ncbi:MAG: twitch domain-containing radical SAM protein [Verrucomicrobiales bacterium]|nr:twitch domain-containing radical SAM protein [Verrucomicrobiales bacterium]
MALSIPEKDLQLIRDYLDKNPNLDFYCPLPFSHFSSSPDGRYKPCCVAKASPYTTKDKSPLEFFNSDVMEDLRRDMREGQITDHVIDYCKRCLITEAQSGHSKRIEEIKKNGRTYDTDKFNSIKLKLFGNFCNLKCVMCAPLQSSKWAAEVIEHGALTVSDPEVPEASRAEIAHATAWPIRDFPVEKSILSPFSVMDKDKFYRDMEYIVPRLKKLECTGGEPLINEDVLEFIRWIIKKGWNKTLSLKFVTNGTCFAKDLTFLGQFKKVRFSISVDGVGPRGEYLRYGTKWAQLKENIQRYRRIKNLQVVGNTCITALNIGYLDEIFEFFESVEVPFKLSNILVGPRYLRALNLPNGIKARYREKLEKTKWRDQMGIALRILEMEEDLPQFRTMVRYLEALDLRRKTSLEALWPEFYEFLRAAEKPSREPAAVTG